ncbi:MAG TPA: TIM barrel protein [Luteitalea sp.]|nr:TIM barrel protein [Luteitalea sp.]
MQITRRGFGATLGALAVVGVAAHGQAGPTRLRRFGVQAGIVREALAADFDGSLARLAALGITTIELQWYGGNFGRSPQQIRRACDAAGIRVTSALVRAGAVLVGWPRHLEALHVLGASHLVVVNLTEDEAQSIDDWREWADRFSTAGAAARKADLWLGLHNEPHFVTPLEGRIPYDEFIARSNPETVALSMDAANMIRGGGDPIAYLRRHPARYRSGHLKDLTPAGIVGGRFGEGRLPLQAVLDAMPTQARNDLFLEHPLGADPFGELARIARLVA